MQLSDIRYMSLDIETYSSVDIKKCGHYKYSESPDAEVLLIAYSINGSEVNIIDVASGETMPSYILEAIVSDTVKKWAFHASFERIFLSIWISRYYPQYFSGRYLNPDSWRCSLVWSAYNGLPLSLEGVGEVLGLEEQKLKEGKELIKYFCCPCKPTKVNGGRTRNMPNDAPDKWSLFKKYCIRDVEVEMNIQKKLSRFPVPDSIWQEYIIDQQINDRGIELDMDMVEKAIKFDDICKEQLISELKAKTGLDNPNSVMQMKEWLSDRGISTESLDKKAITDLLSEVPKDVADVLVLRQQMAKSSIKKYEAMQSSVCSDNRAHGMFMFYGANRSGRWAGRIIQLQNLPQNKMEDLAEARDIVKSGDFEMMNLLYNVPNALSQLIRTAFVAKPGYKFCVADFSAIEARVLAYLAGEKWRMKAFAENKDIYCESASHMFGVPVEKHGVNGHLRQKGKISELALGYGGSTGALISMGALDMGLTEEELLPLVSTWRAANPAITQLWWDIDSAVKDCVKMRTVTSTHGLKFIYKSGLLLIELPSGRHLTYIRPRIGENKFGGESVCYEGVGTNKKWDRSIESYGPKFCENICQAVSRDILCYAMKNLSAYRICAHIHDELVIECPMDTDLETICKIMGQTPEWASGLILRADGYETPFYKKD